MVHVDTEFCSQQDGDQRKHVMCSGEEGGRGEGRVGGRGGGGGSGAGVCLLCL